MNNTLSLMMLSCMALFAIYVIIRLYTQTQADSKTGTLGIYIIVGGILGAIIGWFIGLHYFYHSQYDPQMTIYTGAIVIILCRLDWF